jgi:hypothetical protein
LWLLAALTFAQPVAAQVPEADQVPLLRFADFYRLPMGSKGLEMADTLLQSNGRRVRLNGYMVQQEQPARGHLMLTPRPVRMSEQADGDADDLPAAWAMVYLDPAQQDFAVPYQRGLIEVSGLLSVGRLEAADGRVSWVRLQIDANATRAMSAFEVGNDLQVQQHTH